MRAVSVLQNRISKPIKTLVADVKHGYWKLGFSRFMSSSFKGSGIGDKFAQKVHKIILKKLDSEFGYVLEKYQNYDLECKYDPDAPVWVCWLQGIDQAPPIVKKCVDSIVKSTKRKVVFLDFNNISNYYKLPDYINQKKGIISNTELADILRVSLLAEYGGLWIDSTIFIPNQLPEQYFEYEFFTCKREPSYSNYISQYCWTTFLLGCQKGCVLFCAVRDILFEYWKKENYLVDYFLLDYTIKYVVNNLKKAESLLDKVPYNNPNIEELQNRMNFEYNQSLYNELINNTSTYLFKLSWRMSFKEKTKDGKETYYNKLMIQQ